MEFIMKKILNTLLLLTLVFGIIGCTIVNRSFPVAGPTLSELNISDEFTTEVEVKKVLGFDLERLLKYSNTNIGTPTGSFNGDISGLMLSANTGMLPLNSIGISGSTYTYALNKLMSENPGYDIIITPKFNSKLDGIPPLYWTEKVEVKARLGRVKEDLLN